MIIAKPILLLGLFYIREDNRTRQKKKFFIYMQLTDCFPITPSIKLPYP